MRLFLMIDIGAGTMDILCYDADSGEHFKAVVPSPVRHKAWMIERTSGPLAVDGVEMGGGPVTQALRRRCEEHEVVVSASAAATLHHDMERVGAWGFKVVDDKTISPFLKDSAYTPVVLGDVEPERIAKIIEGFGLRAGFEAVALCAQDHGTAPPGVSHLDYRHNLFQSFLQKKSRPERLLFESSQVPSAFNRLRSMARGAGCFNAREIYVMDSGMAAILGASRDLQAPRDKPVAVLDIATSHTVGAVMEGDELAGFFEYHTHDVTADRIDQLLRALPDGNIEHARVLAEGGHGAYLHKTVGFANISAIIATGPKRRMMAGSRLPITWGAPWGDNMMTGTVGLLEAMRRRKQMAPIVYL